MVLKVLPSNSSFCLVTKPNIFSPVDIIYTFPVKLLTFNFGEFYRKNEEKTALKNYFFSFNNFVTFETFHSYMKSIIGSKRGLGGREIRYVLNRWSLLFSLRLIGMGSS